MSRGRYFPSSRKGSDNESDVSFTRSRRRDPETGSESDATLKWSSRQRKTKSVGADWYDREMKANMRNIYLGDKENRPNGSAPSLHSAPAGESRQKKMRRRRSKSPGTSKRPPEELKNYIEFDLLEPTEDFTEEQLKEIPYVNVETKAEPFKVKYSPSNRRRYRSPKRKSAGDLDVGVKTGYVSEEAPPPYSAIVDRKQTPDGRQTTPGYYSDTGSLSRRNHKLSPQTQNQYNNSVMSHSKPIDATDDAGEKRTDISRGHTSTRNTGSGSHMHSGQQDDLHKEQGQVDIGQGQQELDQGHDLEDDDRNHDSGLNSSHSSSQGQSMMTPKLLQGAGRRMYGTNDTIARLYSSPGGTRRYQNQTGNQSGNLTNENSPYNRDSPRSASQNRSYNSQTLPMDRGHMRSTQSNTHYSNKIDANVGQFANARSQGVNSSGFDNHYSGKQSQTYRYGDNSAGSLLNGYVNHARQNGGTSHDYGANQVSHTNTVLRQGTNYPDSRVGHSNSGNNYDYVGNSPNRGQQIQPQRYGSSPQKYGLPPQNQGQTGSPYNQYGQASRNNPQSNQSSWSYGGRPRQTVTQSTGAEARGQVQQKRALAGNSFGQPPVSSSSPAKPGKQIHSNTLQGTNPAANHYHSSSHMTSPYLRSIENSPNPLDNTNSTTTGANRVSPRRQLQFQPELKVTGSHGDRMGQGYSKQRAPAFGRSDIWTEL